MVFTAFLALLVVLFTYLFFLIPSNTYSRLPRLSVFLTTFNFPQPYPGDISLRFTLLIYEPFYWIFLCSLAKKIDTIVYCFRVLLKNWFWHSIQCGGGVFSTQPPRLFPLLPAMLWQQLDVTQFNSVLTAPTQKQHLMPQVKASVPPDCLTSDANQKSRLLTVLLNKWL